MGRGWNWGLLHKIEREVVMDRLDLLIDHTLYLNAIHTSEL